MRDSRLRDLRFGWQTARARQDTLSSRKVNSNNSLSQSRRPRIVLTKTMMPADYKQVCAALVKLK
jgi:hypothetical protein